MNSQNDKESAGHVKAAIIGGIFALLAACIGGSFLILNTLVNNGVIFVGISNPNAQTATPAPSPVSSSNQPTVENISQVQATNTPPVLPSPNPVLPQSSIQMDGPFREHKVASVGTGVFTQVTFSDGNAPYSQAELDANHFQIYRIRPEENQDGCGVSIYNTDKVWFSSSANTVFSVNNQEVGKLSVTTGKHGFVADWSVKVGDKICAAGYASSGFHIIFGPDMYYHYDSYCYRGDC